MSKVLLVEDDINLREIYAARLNAEGHELILASDGEEALSKAVAEQPALILLDIMMPKISGFDVLDILRSTPETENTKVVILSALSQQSDQERGEKLGVDKYLIKSQITLEDVVETVKEMVDDSETGNAQSIVTTSGGRLPDDNHANPEDGENQQSDSGIQQASDQQGAGQRPSAQQQTGPDQDQPQPQKKAASAQTADEINDIDTQMQQSNPDDTQDQQASQPDTTDDQQNSSGNQQTPIG